MIFARQVLEIPAGGRGFPLVIIIWIAVKEAMVCDKSAAAQLFKAPEPTNS